MSILTVDLPQRSYDINIGPGLLGQTGKVAAKFATDPEVYNKIHVKLRDPNNWILTY